MCHPKGRIRREGCGEELHVPKGEGVWDCVGASTVIFSWTKEE